MKSFATRFVDQTLEWESVSRGHKFTEGPAVDPDGNVYFIDWYDAQQCHVPDPKKQDRGNGRIFKVTYGETYRLRIQPFVAPSHA